MDFVHVTTPTLTGMSCEGIGELFKVMSTYMQSHHATGCTAECRRQPTRELHVPIKYIEFREMTRTSAYQGNWNWRQCAQESAGYGNWDLLSGQIDRM